MKYVIRAAPILVALALFVSFLVVQQSRPANAAVVGTVTFGVLEGGLVTTFDGRAFSTSEDTDRINIVQLTDLDFVNATSGETIFLTSLTSELSRTGWICKLTLTENGDTGIFQGSFKISELLADEDDSVCPGGIPTLRAEAGDEIEAEYTDADPIATRRDILTIENNSPDVISLLPDHETVGDSKDITVTIQVTDKDAGVTEPLDLPSMALLVSDKQCKDIDLFDGDKNPLFTLSDLEAGSALLDVTTVDCGSSGTDIFEQLFLNVDEDNVGEITNGWEAADLVSIIPGTGDFGEQFVTVFGIDEAGNVTIHDVDEGDPLVVMAQYTADTADPTIHEVRTGVLYDADDEELKFNERSWIQVIFDDKTDLDKASIDATDFSVEGHAIKSNGVKWFDADPADLAGDLDFDGTVLAETDKEAQVRRMVFIELVDELDSDETPEVNVLPNGVDDEAGNDITSGSEEAIDAIGPGLTVQFISPLPSSNVLAGEDVEVVIEITSDEGLKGNGKPIVQVHLVEGLGQLTPVVTKALSGSNRWQATISDPDDTGFFNIHIEATDADGNKNDIGIDPVDFIGTKTSGKVDGVGCTTAAPCVLTKKKTTGTVTTGTVTVTCTIAAPCTPIDGFIDGFFEKQASGDVDEDAIFFEGDLNLFDPFTIPEEDGSRTFRSPFFVTLDFGSDADGETSLDDDAEDSEYAEDTFEDISLLSATLDGADVMASASTADGTKWLIAIVDIALGDHELIITAEDEAGNDLGGDFTLEFEVTAREAIEVNLNPGWNLVSLPGNPTDPSIDAVMAGTPDVEIVITYDPTVPGGFLVAQRTEDGGLFSGNLKTMTAARGYWVLTDSFDPIEVDVPPLGQGAGVLPPTVPVAKGWNLLPVQDPTGEFESGDELRATDYFTSAEDVSAVYDFDTIANGWVFINIADDSIDCTTGAEKYTGSTVAIGKSYWVFSTEAGTLVPVPISLDITDAEITACAE